MIASINDIEEIYISKNREIEIIKTLLEICSVLRCEPNDVFARIDSLIETNKQLTIRVQEYQDNQIRGNAE